MGPGVALADVAALLAVAVAAVAVGRRPAGSAFVYAGCLGVSLALACGALARLLEGGAPADIVLPLGLPWIGAHFRVDGLAAVLAIEILTAARALDLRAPLSPADATAAVVALLRQAVPGPGPDRHLAPEIAAVADLVRDGSVVRAVESVTGPLNRLEH